MLFINKNLYKIKRDIFKMYQDSLMSYTNSDFSIDRKQRKLIIKIWHFF